MREGSILCHDNMQFYMSVWRGVVCESGIARTLCVCRDHTSRIWCSLYATRVYECVRVYKCLCIEKQIED